MATHSSGPHFCTMMSMMMMIMAIWDWYFQMGDTKLEINLHKNQHTQWKFLNFEFWINGELSKSVKI